MAADVGARSQLLDTYLKTVSLNDSLFTSASSTVSAEHRHNSTLLEMYPSSCDIQLETDGDINNQRSKDMDDSCHTSTMPPGWIREVRQRKAGKTAGKLDIYITRKPQSETLKAGNLRTRVSRCVVCMKRT